MSFSCKQNWGLTLPRPALQSNIRTDHHHHLHPHLQVSRVKNPLLLKHIKPNNQLIIGFDISKMDGFKRKTFNIFQLPNIFNWPDRIVLFECCEMFLGNQKEQWLGIFKHHSNSRLGTPSIWFSLNKDWSINFFNAFLNKSIIAVNRKANFWSQNYIWFSNSLIFHSSNLPLEYCNQPPQT